MVRAVVRNKGQITLPREIRHALHLQEGDDVAFFVDGDQVVMRGMRPVPTDQAWFWSPEWQAGEKQASEELSRGEGTVFDHAEVFLDSFE